MPASAWHWPWDSDSGYHVSKLEKLSGVWLPVSWPRGSVDMLVMDLREELVMEVACSEAQAALQQYLSHQRTTPVLLFLQKI